MKTFFESIQEKQFVETAQVFCTRLASYGVRPTAFVEWYQDEGWARPDAAVDWFLHEMGDMRKAPWHHAYDPNVANPQAAPAAQQQPTQPQMPSAGAGTAQPDPTFSADVQTAVQALAALQKLPPINGQETFLQKHQLQHAVNSLMQYMSAFAGQMPQSPAQPQQQTQQPDAQGQKGKGMWDKAKAWMGSQKDYWTHSKDFRNWRQNNPDGKVGDYTAQNYQNRLNREGYHVTLQQIREHLINECGFDHDDFTAPRQSIFLERVAMRRRITEIADYIDPAVFAEWYIEEGQYYDDPIELENAIGDFFGKVGGAIKGAWDGISRGWKATGFKQERQKRDEAINAALQALQRLQTTHGEYMKSVPGGANILPHLDQVLAALKKAAGIQQQQDAQADAAGGAGEGDNSAEAEPEAGADAPADSVTDPLADPEAQQNAQDPAVQQAAAQAPVRGNALQDGNALATHVLNNVNLDELKQKWQGTDAAIGLEDLQKSGQLDAKVKEWAAGIASKMNKKGNSWDQRMHDKVHEDKRDWSVVLGSLKGFLKAHGATVRQQPAAQQAPTQQQVPQGYGQDGATAPNGSDGSNGGWGNDAYDMLSHTLYPSDQQLREALEARFQRAKLRFNR